MNDHPRLRRALSAFSEPPADVAVGSVSVAARAAALHRRRQVTVSGIALAAVMLGGLGLVRLQPTPVPDDATVTATDSPTPPGNPPTEDPDAAPGSPAEASPDSSASPDATSRSSEEDAGLAGPTYVQGRYGLVLTVSASPRRSRAGSFVTLTVRAKDTAGSWNGSEVSFGDGPGPIQGASVDCASPRPNLLGQTPAPPEPKPSDVTHEYRHAYRRPGVYTISVKVHSSQYCSDENPETAEARLDVRVLPGDDLSNGPAAPSAGLFRMDSGWDGEPESLTLDLEYSARDEDGWIERVVVDWGDGSAPQTLGPDDDPCEEPDGRWPAGDVYDAVSHEYAAEGTYEVTLTVTSAGCDGRDEQIATAQLSAPVADPPPPSTLPGGGLA